MVARHAKGWGCEKNQRNQLGFFGILLTLFIGLLAWLLLDLMPSEQPFLALFSASDHLELLLIQNYSLPRIAMALLCGGILGAASLLLQQVMNNPLASDNTLGISAGAQFALFMVAVFAPQWLEYSASWIALVGAGLSLLLVLSLGLKTVSPLILVLAGLVVNLYFGSFSSLLMLFYPEESRGLLQWGAGSLVQESWRSAQLLAQQAVIPLGIIALLSRTFAILTLNDANAQSLGISATKLRLIGVLLSSFLIACVVSHVGMLGFIGLAAAAIVRQLGIRRFTRQLAAALVIGALLLSITDLCLQLLAHHRGIHLPSGAVTALVGTPLLLWLLFGAMAQTGRLTEPPPLPTSVFQPRTAFILLLLGGGVLMVALLLGRGANGWYWADFYQTTLLELRLPRVLSALAVGILLATAGVILQRLTQNPMASPELLGVSSGTAMGMMVALFLFSAAKPSLFWLAGIVGALLALLILSAINQRNGMLPEKVLLTGISLSALFGALQNIALASGDLRALQLLAWLSGSTQNVNADFALPFLLASLVLLGVALLFSRWLNLLALQATMAQALGLDLVRARRIFIVFSALLTALATLIIGPLSFIGLLVPQISRWLGVRHAHSQLLLSALLGGMLMVFADFLGRQLLFPYEIPAGLVATLIGGSYFLLMVRKV